NEDGYIWIKGQIDGAHEQTLMPPDVINMSGHRLSTAEVESALIIHKGVSETAVIGTADELMGQAVYVFVMLKPEFTYNANNEATLAKELVLQVRTVIGPLPR
ncbi:hypothetical protein B0H17DRAFT_945357, partial [Mycena rosella]